MNNPVIEFLQTRRSVPAKKMLSTPPDAGHLQQILSCAIRVPDHSNVQPWRIVIFEGQARAQFGEEVILPAAIARAKLDDQILSEALQELERTRMNRGGVVIAVLYTPVIPHKIPQWEQQLSAGAVCAHLLAAAQSLDYAAQWLTEWLAYDDSVIKALGGKPDTDRIAGFIHIGAKAEAPVDRARPDPEKIINHWQSCNKTD